MKFFYLLFFALSCIFFVDASSKKAARIVKDVNDLSRSSERLCQLTKDINILNIIFYGPQVAIGFTSDIIPGIVSLTTVITTTSGAFDDVDADFIVEALLAFVEVHKQLLSIIIGKHGILSNFGFARPILLALQALERVIDALAIALIKLIPTRRDAGLTFRKELDDACGKAIIVYSGPRFSGGDSSAAYLERLAEDYYEHYQKAIEYYRDAEPDYDVEAEPKQYRIRGSAHYGRD